MKKIMCAAIILIVFVAGFAAGRNNAIKSAELYEVTDDGYQINFSGEIHDYIY